MRHAIVLIAALATIVGSPAAAQTAEDPSGHWKGTVAAGSGPLDIEVDLARNASGGFKGALSVPSQGLKGLPLGSVAVQGGKVAFDGPKGVGFRGALSADGKSMPGDFSAPEGTAPITFARTGDAAFDPPPRNAAIGTEMTGVWNGALNAGGRQLRVVLVLTNNPDGTSSGLFDSVDEGLKIPVAITQDGLSLKVDLPMTGGAYTARLVGEGTTLAGTFATKGHDFPLTLTKTPPG